MTLRVNVRTETLRNVRSGTPPNTIHLAEHIRGLVEQTAPGLKGDVLVSIDRENIGAIQVSADVRIYGNFADGAAAETLVDKFLTKPWLSPSAKTYTFEHDEKSLHFHAYASVLSEHC